MKPASTLSTYSKGRGLLVSLAECKGQAKFTLPLGPPAKPFLEGKAFGVKRVYNGRPAPQPHTGIDYPVPVGSLC